MSPTQTQKRTQRSRGRARPKSKVARTRAPKAKAPKQKPVQPIAQKLGSAERARQAHLANRDPVVHRNLKAHIEPMVVETKDGPLEQPNLVIAGGGLMGTAEVADALGVRVQNLQFIKDLPDPVFRLRATRVWLSADIEAFASVYSKRRKNRSWANALAA